jgi:hypothetical protein
LAATTRAALQEFARVAVLSPGEIAFRQRTALT